LLPIRWDTSSLTAILSRIGPKVRPAETTTADLTTSVRVIQRVSRVAVFRLPIFPRQCLREALALYHVLSHAGQPVQFCVGVRKAGGGLIAHSWVTLHGQPILPADRNNSFRVVYAYPDGSTP
jgi:hypothetical protein